MVPPIVVQGTATLAVVTLIMAARPQMENVARTLLETRPALVPSLGRVVPFLVIVEAPVTIVLGRTAIAVLVRSNAAPTMKNGGPQCIYHVQVNIPFAFETVLGLYPTYVKLLISLTDEVIHHFPPGKI
jgi:hypothetical protein